MTFMIDDPGAPSSQYLDWFRQCPLLNQRGTQSDPMEIPIRELSSLFQKKQQLSNPPGMEIDDTDSETQTTSTLTESTSPVVSMEQMCLKNPTNASTGPGQ
jgi:hypothetical protein